jgi:hypothetical protein
VRCCKQVLKLAHNSASTGTQLLKALGTKVVGVLLCVLGAPTTRA